MPNMSRIEDYSVHMKRFFLRALLLWGTCLVTVLPAATVSITASADTGTFKDFPNNNLGSAGTVSCGTLAGNLGKTGASRMLVTFDLAGHVPDGATIHSASVAVRVTKAPSFGVASTFGLHRLLVDWGEGSKGFGTTTGTGAMATTGEATWHNRFHNQTAWFSSGGAIGSDYAASASSSVDVNTPAAYTFASSPAMVADVQAWADDGARNHGWIMISTGEGTLRTARRIATRESTVASFRPMLTVDFSAPPVISDVFLVDGDIRMRFNVQQGRRYEVQRREAAGSGPWGTFTNIGPVGFTGTVTVADTTPVPSRFYQVVEF